MQKKKMQVEKMWAVGVVERSVESAQRDLEEAAHKQMCIRLDGGYLSLSVSPIEPRVYFFLASDLNDIHYSLNNPIQRNEIIPWNQVSG